jgi:tRNA threonylcarbamoyladenosine biosynthesis protein TsaB
MTSLRQILSTSAPLLLIDACSARIHVGLFDATGAARWQTSPEEAGVGIFRCVEALGLDPGVARAFAFCEGPGSVLGVRTSAMALRTWRALAWRPAYAYCSLAVVAHALGQSDLSVIADARRDSWHQYTLGAGLRRVAAGELTGRLVIPAGFRHWSPLPAPTDRTPYSLDDLLPRVAQLELFRETEAPDAFLHEEPNYAGWTPQIHRAAASP